MVTTELTGQPVAIFDKEIADYLSSESFDGGGNTMIVGVENENKDVYRVIKVSGLGDFMNVVGFLWDMELIDILKDSNKAVGGFDARFRPGL